MEERMYFLGRYETKEARFESLRRRCKRKAVKIEKITDTILTMIIGTAIVILAMGDLLFIWEPLQKAWIAGIAIGTATPVVVARVILLSIIKKKAQKAAKLVKYYGDKAAKFSA